MRKDNSKKQQIKKIDINYVSKYKVNTQKFSTVQTYQIHIYKNILA